VAAIASRALVARPRCRADAGEATGDQAPEEGEPGGAVLRGDDVEPERLAEALSVDGDRVHDAGIDGPPALAALDLERIEDEVRVGAPSSGRVRKSSTIASSVLAGRETWLHGIRSTPSCGTSFSTRPVETPAK
jgi:hypothetical protein